MCRSLLAHGCHQKVDLKLTFTIYQFFILKKNLTDADLEAFLPYFSFLQTLNEATSEAQARVVLGPELTGVIKAGEAGLKPGRDDNNEVKMVTEIVKN